MVLNPLKLRKNLTRYLEIDSLETLYLRANELLGRGTCSGEMPLPETPEECQVLGKILYDFGLYQESEKWIRSAAESGNPEAQYDYGMLLYRGCGTRQSFQEALKMFEASMEQGNLSSLERAYLLFSSGGWGSLLSDEVCEKALRETTPEERGKSPEKAERTLELLKQKGESGDEEALVFYACYTDNLDLLRKAAEDGNSLAMSHLSNRYYQGLIECEDRLGESIRWAEKAAEHGNSLAMLGLAIIYSEGFGVDRSPEKAFGYALAAAEAGLVIGCRKVAKMYYHGIGTERSYEKARDWFMASCGDPESQYYLGEMYSNGLGVERSYERAAEWYSLASSEGCTKATVRLASLYSNGHGVEKDTDTAMSFIHDASSQGDEQAFELEICL